MDEKKLRLLWSVSLIVIAVCTLVNSFCRIFEWPLPLPVMLAMCVLELACVFVLVYTSVKLKIFQSK